MIAGRTLCKPGLVTKRGDSPYAVWITLRPVIETCQWWEIYNLIEALWQEIEHEQGAAQAMLFQKELNEVFGEESIGWQMDMTGTLQRILPAAASVPIEEIFRELQSARFAPAFQQVVSARAAYNARPRRDLDVCMNIFDALESVAKEVFSMPTATFGDVLKKARRAFSSETISTLEKLYALASSHFRHGRTEPFALSPPETDFVYVTCLAGIMLFVRLKP